MIHSDESTSILHELCPIQPDTVYHEDCLEGMKRIPDGSVDLILCDLPYGTTQYRWDSVIPTDLLFSEYRRILKPNGTFLLFGSEPFSTVLRMQDLKLYKYDWVWEKDNVTGFADAKNKPMKRHELISVFSKGSIGHKGIVPEGRRMTYNPQGLVSLGDTETGRGKKPTTAVLDGVEYSHRSGKICKIGRFPTARPNAESKKKSTRTTVLQGSIFCHPARTAHCVRHSSDATQYRTGMFRKETISKWGGVWKAA